MDAVTHTLIAVSIGMAGYRHWGRRGVLLVTAAANLPELERFVSLGSAATWVNAAYGACHSLLTAPMLGVAFAALAAWRIRNARLAAAMTALGLGSHLALDVVSGPGVRLFWPLSRNFYGLRLLARYDVLILAVLMGTLLAPRLLNLVNRDLGASQFSREKPARLALIAVGVLLLIRAVAMTTVEGRTQASIAPSAIHPLTWYAIADDGAAYTVEIVTPWSDGPSFRFRKAEPNRAFETAAETPLGQAFLEMARFPHYSLERGEKGMRIRITDMRFCSPGGSSKEYSVEIEVTPQLQVVAQRATL